MDPKDTKDTKKDKDAKETEDVKDTKKTYWYFAVIIIIALIIIIFVINSIKQNEISELQKQIDKLKSDNQDLGSQITGFSSKIDSLKSSNEKIKAGNVPFWSEDGKGMLMAVIPLNYYSARVFSENVVKESDAEATNLVFKSIAKNKTNWIASFVCGDAVDDSSCGGQVMIDEDKKSYSFSLNA